MMAPGIPALPCKAPVEVATHLQGSLQKADFLKEAEEKSMDRIASEYIKKTFQCLKVCITKCLKLENFKYGF